MVIKRIILYKVYTLHKVFCNQISSKKTKLIKRLQCTKCTNSLYILVNLQNLIKQLVVQCVQTVQSLLQSNIQPKYTKSNKRIVVYKVYKLTLYLPNLQIMIKNLLYKVFCNQICSQNTPKGIKRLQCTKCTKSLYIC